MNERIMHMVKRLGERYPALFGIPTGLAITALIIWPFECRKRAYLRDVAHEWEVRLNEFKRGPGGCVVGLSIWAGASAYDPGEIFATLPGSDPIAIQKAIDECPAGQWIQVDGGIDLRGGGKVHGKYGVTQILISGNGDLVIGASLILSNRISMFDSRPWWLEEKP